MSPVRYELGFISQKMSFFIVTAVKNSNLIIILWRGRGIEIKIVSEFAFDRNFVANVP
jgi:hypothetical protein